MQNNYNNHTCMEDAADSLLEKVKQECKPGASVVIKLKFEEVGLFAWKMNTELILKNVGTPDFLPSAQQQCKHVFTTIKQLVFCSFATLVTLFNFNPMQ